MTRPRQVARTVVLAVVAAVLALASVQAADAAGSGRQTVLNNGRVCVQAESNFDWFYSTFSAFQAHGNVYARKPGCSGTLTVPNGSLAVRLTVEKLNGSTWTTCRQTPWVYGGGGDVRSGDIVYEQTAAQYDNYSAHQPPCGAGTYRTLTAAFVRTSAGWEGTALSSGSQFAS